MKRTVPATDRPGRLIALEGGGGAGKSAHAKFVRDWLARQGREPVLTREPGGSPLAEASVLPSGQNTSALTKVR